MSPEDEKRDGWAILIYMILTIACIVLLFSMTTARADTTKVFDATARRWGITVPPGATIDSIRITIDSTKPGMCITFPPIFMAVKIDGRWFPLKWLVDSLPPMYTDDPRCMGDSITPYKPLPHDPVKRMLRYKDTIPVVRARGLDSCFVLGHDTVICHILLVPPRQYDPDKRPGGRFSCDTIHIFPHWEWYDWLNGKRTNIRRVK